MIQTLSVATWNVNSIKARLEIVCNWLRSEKATDVVLLQELKCETDAFPYLEIEDCGYNCAVYGQKTYNGVAILSKYPIEGVQTGLINATFAPDAARYIEGYVEGIKVASIYVPNGESVSSDKFPYKMAFYQNLQNYLEKQLATEERFLLGGDFNVALTEQDLYDPAKFQKDRILFSPLERQALRRIMNIGLIDLYRQHNPHKNGFSWWDYRAGRFDRDEGVRIDYLLASPQLADCVSASDVDRQPRGLTKPSDHTPVTCLINI